MKTNPLLAIVVGFLLFVSFMVSWSAVRYYFSMKELQDLQGRVMEMRQTMAHVQSLVNQCLEYRQSNSAIDPILQGFGIPLTNTPTIMGRGSKVTLNEGLVPLN